MARTGLFVYGFIRATEDRVTDILGIDQGGAPGVVHVIADGGVGAVVSVGPGGDDKAMPSRKNLGSHNRVIQAFLAEITPMSFGQVVKGEAQIKKFMKKNRAAILAEIKRLDDKVEMSLRVRWDVENIFEYFMQADPELAEARDRVFLDNPTPSHAEKVELGRLFETRLGEVRTRETDQVLASVERAVREVKVNVPKTDKTVMDIVVLVDRAGLPQFERKIHEVAEKFPDQYAFEFTGPWAPFSFVELDLQAA